MKKKIVIFGGSGQLGQQLIKQNRLAYELIVPTHAVVDVVNEIDVAHCLRHHKPYAVINAAAYTAVDACEQQMDLAYAVNVQAAQHMAVYAQEVGAKFIHLSTDYVFDGTASAPYEPDDPCAPLNQYGLTKRVGEQAVLQAMPTALIVRTAWLYSESGHNFLKTILKLALTEQPLQVVNDQVGSPTYAGHLATALYQLLELKVAGGVYHYAGDSVMSWHAFAHYVLNQACLLSDAYEAQPIGTLRSSQLLQPALRPLYSALSSSKLAAMGIQPSSFQQGVQQSLKSLLGSTIKP